MTKRYELLCMLIFMAACSNNAGSPRENSIEVPAQVVFRDANCVETREGVRVIADGRNWDKWLDKQSSLVVSGEPTARPKLEFDSSRVLIISMGNRSTAGFGIAFGRDSVTLTDSKLVIVVDWIEPTKDLVVAQVLTSPCTAIQVDTTDFDTAEIRNRDGSVLFRHAL